jgi:recombinational DNA repair protein RecR
MEIEEFVKRVEEQANRCAICRNLAKKLFVDHCHDKSHVRELLCQRCNSLLGQAEDQIEILQSAIDYLIKHS